MNRIEFEDKFLIKTGENVKNFSVIRLLKISNKQEKNLKKLNNFLQQLGPVQCNTLQ